MATKGNIARSGAMSKSFYQSTKSKWTRNHRHRHRHRGRVDAQERRSTKPIDKGARNHRHRHRGQDHRSTKTFAKWTRNHRHREQDHSQKPQIHKAHRQEDAQSTASASRARPQPKTTHDQKPQNDPHKNHTRSTKTKNAQSGL